MLWHGRPMRRSARGLLLNMAFERPVERFSPRAFRVGLRRVGTAHRGIKGLAFHGRMRGDIEFFGALCFCPNFNVQEKFSAEARVPQFLGNVQGSQFPILAAAAERPPLDGSESLQLSVQKCAEHSPARVHGIAQALDQKCIIALVSILDRGGEGFPPIAVDAAQTERHFLSSRKMSKERKGDLRFLQGTYGRVNL